MTLRDRMGREVGRGFRVGNAGTPMADSSQRMAKPLQYCKVISLQLKWINLFKKNLKKKKKKESTLINHTTTLFQQHKGWFYTWTSPDGKYLNQIDYILCSQRWRSSIQSAKTRPGADCGSDHELCIAKFRLKLKKVGKTARPFKYDLNQIPYDYTVEVMNRFEGFDLVDRVPEELWMEVHKLYGNRWPKMVQAIFKCTIKWR